MLYTIETDKGQGIVFLDAKHHIRVSLPDGTIEDTTVVSSLDRFANDVAAMYAGNTWGLQEVDK